MILYVNACVREGSRTKRLADALISRLGGKTHELRLESISFPEADEAFLKRRDMLIAKKIFDDDLFEYARLFASADAIVIAAPYWDLSFPAKLKQFFEQINVLGDARLFVVDVVALELVKCHCNSRINFVLLHNYQLSIT